jgi:hypothetical protein
MASLAANLRECEKMAEAPLDCHEPASQKLRHSIELCGYVARWSKPLPKVYTLRNCQNPPRKLSEICQVVAFPREHLAHTRDIANIGAHSQRIWEGSQWHGEVCAGHL